MCDSKKATDLIQPQKKKAYNIAYASRRRAHLKWRYRNDPEYRERQKNYSRNFYKHPDRVSRGKQLRKKAYQKNPELHRRKSKEWIIRNYEKWKQRNAERRAKNREKARAECRWNAINLSDRYVREQLSKYTQVSAWEWTPEQVESKRQKIIASREKRITTEKAAAIRHSYNELGVKADALAGMFNVSVSSVYLTLANKLHVDPSYRLTRIRNLGHLAKVLGLFNTAATIGKTLNENC